MMPDVADAIMTIPRGSIESLLETMTSPNGEVAGQVLQKFVESPEYFGDHAEDLANAIISGNAREKVNELMQNEEFQRLVFGIKPPEMQ